MESFYDNEKVFIPRLQFLSMIKVLVSYRDSYLSIANAAQTIVATNALSEQISVLNDKLTTMRSEFHTSKPEPQLEPIELPLGPEPKTDDEPTNYNGLLCEVCKEKQFETTSGATCKNGHGGSLGISPVTEEVIDDKPSSELSLELDTELSLDLTDAAPQGELETFLENPDFGDKKPMVDTIMEKVEDSDVQKKSVTVKKSISDCFTSRFLEGNLLTLETFVSNMVTDKLPLDTFTTLLARKLEVSRNDLFSGCTDKEYWQMVYLTTRYSKAYLNKHLNENAPLPASSTPLRYDCKKTSKLNKSIMHDLFLYFVYYTHLKNQLEQRDANTTGNKGIVTFALKAILSPFIFSHFKSISTMDVLISEINTRYDQYKKLGVFDKLNEQVQSKYGYDINISNHSISETLKKLHITITQYKDKFWIDDFFNSRKAEKIVKFDYETFNNHEFDREQIIAILALETNYAKNGHVDFGTLPFDQSDIMKLPQSILKEFGIEEKTYNNSNLVRYIKEVMDGNNYIQTALDITEKINESYHDLHGHNLEFVNLPEDVLKMFCIWDLRVDKRLSANYSHMKTKINESSLDRSSALSMLNDIEPKDEISFVASLSTAV
jgi:hypothetical protein